MLTKKDLKLAEIVVILAILASSYVLFAYERKNHNPDYNKNWVAFYFVDPNAPAKGVTAENHSGQTTEFTFCLVPDSADLMEPGDLSCSITSVVQTVTKNIAAGNTDNWAYSKPANPGKFWVVLQYKDGDLLKTKDLSFQN
jgi:hypothetical protein